MRRVCLSLISITHSPSVTCCGEYYNNSEPEKPPNYTEPGTRRGSKSLYALSQHESYFWYLEQEGSCRRSRSLSTTSRGCVRLGEPLLHTEFCVSLAPISGDKHNEMGIKKLKEELSVSN